MQAPFECWLGVYIAITPTEFELPHSPGMGIVPGGRCRAMQPTTANRRRRTVFAEDQPRSN